MAIRASFMWGTWLLFAASSCAHVAPEAGCRQGRPRSCVEQSAAAIARGDTVADEEALTRLCEVGDPSECYWLATLRPWDERPEERALARRRLEEFCSRGNRPACKWLEFSAPEAPQACVARAGRGLDKAELRTAIVSHTDYVRNCFEAMLYEGDNTEGRVSIHWTIGPEGQVLSASTSLNTLPSPRVAECIRRGTLTWRFPCPAGGGRVDVTFPYILKVKEEDEATRGGP